MAGSGSSANSKFVLLSCSRPEAFDGIGSLKGNIAGAAAPAHMGTAPAGRNPALYSFFEFTALNGDDGLLNYAIYANNPNDISQLFDYDLDPSPRPCRSYIRKRSLIKECGSIKIAIKVPLPFILLRILDSIEEDGDVEWGSAVSSFCTINNIPPVSRLTIFSFCTSTEAIAHLSQLCSVSLDNGIVLAKSDVKVGLYLKSMVATLCSISSPDGNAMDVLREWMHPKHMAALSADHQ